MVNIWKTYENKRFILPKEEDIYNFLSSDIEYYMKNFEVLATDNFKTKERYTNRNNDIMTNNKTICIFTNT